ncbi:TonB-dependent receptor [Parahaliea mediterranea]|uniref:TonB-dependent receptor n=1 Tax=Parahaliea mediterranea TaxID=651086 RepID=UPI001474CEF6|nr:TonB-dependent receptor [Parahaliea mediterranea]
MKFTHSKHLLSLAISSALSCGALIAQAQQLEEVVVTAQKRVESIQGVPISIMAVTDAKLEQAGIDSADDLTRIVPNLRINRQAQASATSIRMRGVGSDGNNAIDPSVAPFIDGVYIARGGAILSSFLDVASVEILRGPQGTLFGRNATTGAVQINTHAPQFDELSGEVFAEYGNFDARRLRGIVNVPVSESFALRFAATADQRDGYYHNRLDDKDYGDRDATTARASARWQPSDSLDWAVRVDYADMQGDGALPPEVASDAGPARFIDAIGSVFGPLSPSIDDAYDGTVNQRIVGDLDDSQWGISSDLNWDLQSDYRVRWIGSYRSWENEQLDGDVVFTGMDFLNRLSFYDTESTSQEIQLISPEGAFFDGRMDFVAGAYYFQEDYAIGENLNLGASFCPVLIGGSLPDSVPLCQSLAQTDATVQRFDQDAESMAVFLETKWKLSDTLELTLGGRYTEDSKEASFDQQVANPFAGSLRAPEQDAYRFEDEQFTYRVVLSWFVTEDTMLFANYSTGYKSGGINSSGSAQPLFERRLFDSEQVDDIELGIKTTLLDGLMQVNATAYRMEIDEFQDRAFQDASFIVTNAGSLRQQGLELELKAAATEHLTLDLAFAYLDSEFTDFKGATPLPGCAVLPSPGTPSCPNPQDHTGRAAPFSPEWEINAGIAYTRDFSNGMYWTASANWQYVDDFIAGGTELSRQAVNDAYELVDARFTVASADDTWTFSIYGQNLTDERYAEYNFTQVLGGALGLLDTSNGDTVYRHYVSAPRTYGVSVKYAF